MVGDGPERRNPSCLPGARVAGVRADLLWRGGPTASLGPPYPCVRPSDPITLRARLLVQEEKRRCGASRSASAWVDRKPTSAASV